MFLLRREIAAIVRWIRSEFDASDETPRLYDPNCDSTQYLTDGILRPSLARRAPQQVRGVERSRRKGGQAKKNTHPLWLEAGVEDPRPVRVRQCQCAGRILLDVREQRRPFGTGRHGARKGRDDSSSSLKSDYCRATGTACPTENKATSSRERFA